MKALFSFKVLLPVLCLVFLSSHLKAQDDMGKPAPVKSSSMEMMMGTWKSDPYEMMGSKWSDVVTFNEAQRTVYVY